MAVVETGIDSVQLLSVVEEHEDVEGSTSADQNACGVAAAALTNLACMLMMNNVVYLV